jgi:hypothetical protein
MMPAERMHLAKFIHKFYLGGREALQQAAAQRGLERGDKLRLAVPLGGMHGGLVPVREIRFEGGAVYEVEERAAADLIRAFGINFGEDGLSTQAIEGA